MTITWSGLFPLLAEVHQLFRILKKSYGKNGKFLNMLDPLGYTTGNHEITSTATPEEAKRNAACRDKEARAL